VLVQHLVVILNFLVVPQRESLVYLLRVEEVLEVLVNSCSFILFQY
jgi:hypothetical protein